MTFRIRDVQSMRGRQVILWLEDEQSGADGPGDNTQWCVRLTVDDAPGVITALVDAYAQTMQRLAVELGAGGCRTCGNERRVTADGSGGFRPFASLLDHPHSAIPCPVCIPRAEKRVRSFVMLRRKDRP